MQPETLSHNELKAALFAHIRDRGVLKSMKGTLRKELLTAAAPFQQQHHHHVDPNDSQLVALNADGQPSNMVSSSSSAPSSPTDNLCESLIEGYLRHKEMSASRTVFLGESGLPCPATFAQQQKSDDDLCGLLGLSPLGTNNQISNETCILTQLIRSQLKHSGRLSDFSNNRIAEVGVQCNLAEQNQQQQNSSRSLSSRDINTTSQSHYESIEYKLSLVEQSFIRSNQVCEQNSRLQSEVNFSKLQQRIRDECQSEAKHLLQKWKEAEETLIRREEKLKAEERIQSKVKEFKELEKKLREEVDTEKMKAELQLRRISQEKLRLEEDRNDLKKAVYLREQTKVGDEREMAGLRAQLRDAQSHSAALEAQVEHLQRQADLSKVSELRRLDLKEREVNDLLAQLHESHDRIAQLRFESRSLAEECAHSLDAAARVATMKKQRDAKEVLSGGGYQQQQQHQSTSRTNTSYVSPYHQQSPSSSSRLHQQQQQTKVTTPAATTTRHQQPTVTTKQQSPPSASGSAKIPPKNANATNTKAKVLAADEIPDVSPIKKVAVQQQHQPVQEQKKKSPSPAAVADDEQPAMIVPPSSSTSAKIEKSPSPVKPQEVADTSIASSTASSTSSTANSNDDFETSTAASSPAKSSPPRTDSHGSNSEERKRQEAEAAKEEQERQDRLLAEAAAKKKAEQAEAEAKRKQQEKEEREKQEKIFKQRFEDEIFTPEKSKREEIASESSQLFTSSFIDKELQERKTIEKAQEGNKIRQYVAQCETDCNKQREDVVETEDKEWRSILWQLNHEATLLKAKNAKADEEVFVPPPQVLKRDSDDSDYDSDNTVDIFGKNSDDDSDDGW